MYTITLASKRDVHRFRDSFKSICDKHGIRLGKSNDKPELIIAELLNFPNYNTLLGVAANDENQYQVSLSQQSYLRIAVPRNTFGAKDRIISLLRDRINKLGHKIMRLTVFFHQRDGVNYPLMGFLVEFDQGEQLLFDSHSMNMSNTKAESEILSLFTHLSVLIGLEFWYFVAKKLTGDLSRISILSAVNELKDSPVKMFSSSWREIFPLSHGSTTPSKLDNFQLIEWQRIFDKSMS